MLPQGRPTALCVLLLSLCTLFLSTHATSPEAIRRLEQWAFEHQLPNPDGSTPLYINVDAPLRGIYTKQALTKGDVMVNLTLDNPILITKDRIMTDNPALQFLSELPEADQYVNSQIYFALWTLEQKYKGAESLWAPYIDVLPESFTIPTVVCSEEMLEPVAELQEAKKLLQAKEMEDQLLSGAWDFLKETFFPHFQRTYPQEKISLDELRWAYHAIKTRTWSNLQIPWVDMFNHASQGSLPSRDKNNFILHADRDYAAGEEVFISYGAKGNRGLWEGYGFMLEENEFNCIEFHLPDTSANPLFQAFVKGRYKLPLHVCLTASGLGVGHMMESLRMMLAESDELESVGSIPMPVRKPLSLKNEWKALREVLIGVAKRERALKESLELENELLLNHGDNECVRNVLRMRSESRHVAESLTQFILRVWQSTLEEGSLGGGYVNSNRYESMVRAQNGM